MITETNDMAQAMVDRAARLTKRKMLIHDEMQSVLNERADCFGGLRDLGFTASQTSRMIRARLVELGASELQAQSRIAGLSHDSVRAATVPQRSGL